MRLLYSKGFLVLMFVVVAFGLTGCALQQKAAIDAPMSDSSIMTEDALDATATTDSSSSEPITDTDGDVKVNANTVTEVAAGVKEFTITAKNWEFTPAEITVNKGDRVRLKIMSVDVDHGFAIAAFNVDQKLTPGKTEIVEFIADKAGSYTFFCSVFCGGGHREMKGTLIVK